MFSITNGKGFHITFSNGYTVSVQWGEFNYCDHYTDPCSKTAEIAAWSSDGVWLDINGSEVAGYCTPEEVLAFMNRVAAIKKE